VVEAGSKRLPKGVSAALGAAVLFGLNTPLAKLLLGDVPPLLLAGLFYLGSGVGLTMLRLARRLRGRETSRLARKDVPWLGGAILFGGVLGPVLLLVGLQRTYGNALSSVCGLAAPRYAVSGAAAPETVRRR